MTIRAGRIKININFFFAASLTLLLILDKSGFILVGFIAALIHESGHLTAMLIFKSRIDEITLGCFGMRIKTQYSSGVSYIKETIIALSGPAANFIFAVGLLLWGKNEAAMVNVSLGIFNLLPVEFFDGGRALEHFLCIFFPIEKVSKIMNAAAVIFILPLSVLGFLVLIVSKYNFSLLAVAGYLIFLVIKKKK